MYNPVDYRGKIYASLTLQKIKSVTLPIDLSVGLHTCTL